jgi:cytochrome P450
MAEHVVTMDAPLHTRTRGLLSRLITPKRLKEKATRLVHRRRQV